MELWKVLAVVVIVGLSAISLFLLSKTSQTQTSLSGALKIEDLPPANNTDAIVMQVVSDTEYSSGETGQFILRVTDAKNNPISTACFGSIAYPDKTIFVNNQTMVPSAFLGNYFINFTTPANYGIYEEYAECYVNTPKGIFKASKSSSFHISDIRDVILNTNSTLYNELVNIHTDVNNLPSAITVNITGTITNATALVLNQMTVYYNSLYNTINGIPSNVVGAVVTQGPNWFSCLAQKISGVYPAGSTCGP